MSGRQLSKEAMENGRFNRLDISDNTDDSVNLGTTNFGSNVQTFLRRHRVDQVYLLYRRWNSQRSVIQNITHSGKQAESYLEHYTNITISFDFGPAPYPYQEAGPGFTASDYGTTDEQGPSSSTSSYNTMTMPWVRNETYAAAPYESIEDDNRLLGPFAIQGNSLSPGESAEMGTTSIQLTDTHWASQFSWLNCGWFGFNTLRKQSYSSRINSSRQQYQTLKQAQHSIERVLNGPPTETGFGPIDDLIDFIRNWDTMIMEKIDLERMYQGVLNRYTAAKMQFDKIADFDLKPPLRAPLIWIFSQDTQR